MPASRQPTSAPRQIAALLCSLALFAALASLQASAAGKASPSRLLVDFEDSAAVRLEPSESVAKIVSTGSNHALQITTKAEAAYPSVTLVPRAGKWDLSGFEGMEMDVVNPQNFEVRVLLAINNPGSDGTHHCNVESATIKARGKGKVTVPFGNWHGNTGHDLDLKNVLSFAVLLDRPGKGHTFLVANLRAVRFDSRGLDSLRADPFFLQLKAGLGRGVNLGNALDAPNEGEWGVTLKDDYFTKIKQAGFDSVRIPVRWSNHAARAAPYVIDATFLARVDWAVGQALKNRLIPVLNMHHYKEVFEDPDGHRSRYLGLWQQIAEHYKSYPPALVFELLNEPEGKLTSDKWNPLLAEAIAIVRHTNPTREIVVGPTHWNSINDLDCLELPETDRHLIVTVHFYNPFQFTHQGADWVGQDAQRWLGTHWTGTPAERKAILKDLDKAIAWAVDHRRPIYLGEFGSYNRGDLESRARWTRFVAQSALERKMSFAYWEFCSGFGVYDPNRNAWIEPLKEALVGAKGD